MGIIIRMKGKAVKTGNKIVDRIFDDIEIGSVGYAKNKKEAYLMTKQINIKYPFVKDKKFIIHKGSKIGSVIDSFKFPFDTGKKGRKWK